MFKKSLSVFESEDPTDLPRPAIEKQSFGAPFGFPPLLLCAPISGKSLEEDARFRSVFKRAAGCDDELSILLLGEPLV